MKSLWTWVYWLLIGYALYVLSTHVKARLRAWCGFVASDNERISLGMEWRDYVIWKELRATPLRPPAR